MSITSLACATKVGNQLGNGCKGMAGTIIASGGTCETVCARGYTPSVVTRRSLVVDAVRTASQEPERWWLHQLHPLFFIPFCWACWAGFSVSRGALAKTDLPFVNRGTKAKLACFAGTLKPNAYICQEDKCKAVTGPVRDGIGWNVEHYIYLYIIVWFNSGYITG